MNTIEISKKLAVKMKQANISFGVDGEQIQMGELFDRIVNELEGVVKLGAQAQAILSSMESALKIKYKKMI